jgi:hypothetical protein
LTSLRRSSERQPQLLQSVTGAHALELRDSLVDAPVHEPEIFA